jgi:hypothetical protein
VFLFVLEKRDFPSSIAWEGRAVGQENADFYVDIRVDRNEAGVEGVCGNC